jgi:8-oxo-dGTP pyrophosphatase MutT (NUDIX family)
MAECAPCVAALATPQDRLEAVRAALVREAEPLVALTHLLHLCRDRHAELWERIGDPACERRVAAALEPVTALLAARPGAAVLDAAVRQALADALVEAEGTPAVLVARALAELLDEHFAHTFTDSFRGRSPYRPGVGDPIPLDTPDLRAVTRIPPTAPPWRLANRLDETRHVRLAGDWAVRFRVVFDYGLYDVTAGLVTADTVVATCHPNRTMAEFELPEDAEGRTFPVRPADPAGQHRRVDRLIGRAVAAGAGIVVLPELAVTPSLARRLRAWTRRPDGPRLLVAGSYHHQDGPSRVGAAPGRRRNTALAWVAGHTEPLLHDKHSPADRPVTEDIQPQGWPEQRVYVLADGWHLVIAICRDLLNPEAVHTLAETGANLVLVPAMSESLTAFGGPAAHLVGARQALVAVANNPGRWPDSGTGRAPSRALFGHPGFARQTRLVHTPDPGPGIALLTVGSGQIAWLDDPAGAPVPDPAGQRRVNGTIRPRPEGPRWLRRLAAHVTAAPAAHAGPAEPVALRPAAVLVLLTDDGDGPRVLLTERARDLNDYPGRLVFPGGAADPRDPDPVATALREAHEETGLAPDSVRVLGALPAFALPETRFLVTPVLAWTAGPVFSADANPAEVRAVGWYRLTEVAGDGNPYAHTDGPPAAGLMTTAVVDLLTGLLARADHAFDTRATTLTVPSMPAGGL